MFNQGTMAKVIVPEAQQKKQKNRAAFPNVENSMWFCAHEQLN